MKALTAFAVGLALATGCTTVRPIAHPSLVGREVEVGFMLPRDLELATPAGDRLLLEDLHAVRGRALEVNDNVLTLQVSWWRGSGIWQYQRTTVVASLHLLDPELWIGERRFSTQHTVLGIAATAAVLGVLFLFLLGRALGES